ncbi:MAG TPA: bifunctional UDP-3-O-[3-hydroxymyristoyl] N-acetylglucosamine deacetylase/3-hydroxyacyl-ACP dehydratase [Gemmatimonadaceae bacterium]|jgi:UDP-3-O-[3-hydroxymyristoyl] N-acetylglucosamine deacetylase/3-hydroxyacyl-[acyl-carrier-protein] dehydratase|nr:bifunctional UDP-3-O-[3-hydroxymyristoyl] N-acetylglucosamine deacetylase/3-hydroxyacyl-ACP dehydratase [Gemmatimonadaceae bacterium]
MKRRTIARPVSLEGIGLHLGEACHLSFRPAPSGAGITFCRTDLPGGPAIRALAENAVLTERRTQLGEDPVSVHTVEHVLAAVAGCDIDDVEIAIDAPEPPIMDGSARPFVDALHAAGSVETADDVKLVAPRRSITLIDGESTYVVSPAASLELDVSIDFPHRAIGRQRGVYQLDADTFMRDVAPARTFGFTDEVESLRAKGLIKGASLENAVVLDENGVIGGGSSLRWPDEFVRHKALDCVGDLALAGGRVRARVTATKPSHRGTVKLVRAMNEAIAKETTVLDIEEIMKVLPHRYPFLLVDRIIEVEEGKRIVGVKNVTINEPFFQGHFPGHPVMPGVLIIEAMAQVGGMLLMGAVPDRANKVVYFTSLNDVKWRRPVRPGDQIRFELEMKQVRGMMCKMTGVAKVDGKIVAEAEMGAVVRDI